MINSILCRYHEIAIKGANRNHFELALVEELYRLLRPMDLKVHRVRGRIWFNKNDLTVFSPGEMALIEEKLTHAFGVESYSPAAILDASSMEAIESCVDELAVPAVERALAASASGKIRFRIRARRSDKSFPLRSKEIEIALASRLGAKFGGREKLLLDLDEADVTVGVEVREEMSIVYLETLRGPGGLPVGSNDKTLALLSGGIDSPVACYMTMKRGSAVEFLTFHSAPYTPESTVEKVTRVAHRLNEFQMPGRLASCNLAEIQKQIRDLCNPRFRTILYRRMMFRIAGRVARRFKCQALVTGESLGQVASQTVTNLTTINAVTDMLVLRPVIALDKLETIRIAEKIGTFEISKLQVPDSCTVFAPDHPSTCAPLDKILEEEKKLGDFEAVLDKIVESMEVTRP